VSEAAATRELEAAIEALAAEMAPTVVAKARGEAEARAQSVLAERLTRALLDRSQRMLGQEGGSPLAEQIRTEAFGFYLYGVVNPTVRLSGNLPGIDPGHKVFLLEGHQLAAIVSRVSLDEFGEDQLRENLNDAGWLEQKARAHEHVLEILLDSTTVVPMRLCTIFKGEKQVREMLARQRVPLLDSLARLEGKAEWGVKVFVAAEALERVAAERAEQGSDELQPGAAYMARKREEAKAREGAQEIGDEWAQQIHERLSEEAAEALLNPLQRPEVSGRAGEMLLNGVYLVEDAEIIRFRELVAELQRDYREREVAIELTGPWPAYNFVMGSIESAQ
jgi:Gas vesicle synthesis protein GvpL/GvpF